MGEIRLIALDIDQTLSWKNDVISERNLAAIRAAQEAGVFVTIATGRGFLSSKRILDQIRIDGPTIQYGGAVLANSPSGLPLETFALSSELVTEALETAHSLGLHAHVFIGDTVIAEKDCEFFRYYHERTNLPFQIDPDLRQKAFSDVPKVLAYSPEHERAASFGKMIYDALGGRASVLLSSPGFIEINKIGVSKGSALDRMSKRLCIPREEVAAIGDNTLDLSMIEWAGVGVCVENGCEEAKQAADLIVPSCLDDGVAYYIENYVL